jgi:hypothetical protein
MESVISIQILPEVILAEFNRNSMQMVISTGDNLLLMTKEMVLA